MELKQRVHIPVPSEDVWEALNNPEVLKASLPGCSRFDAVPEGGFEMEVTAKVGPVKATFSGEVSLTNINPPHSYTISGGGKGGVAGFAKGSADVRLENVEDGNATLMSYEVQASVGGKLAQIGSRLVSGAARKMADDFFANFVRHLTGDPQMDVKVETIES